MSDARKGEGMLSGAFWKAKCPMLKKILSIFSGLALATVFLNVSGLSLSRGGL